MVALVAAVHGDGRHGVVEVRGQRRVEDRLVVADAVVFAQGAGGDSRCLARFHGHVAVAAPLVHLEADGRGLHRYQMVEQFRILRLCKLDQGGVLCLGGAVVHQQHCLGGQRIAVRIAQGRAGVNHGHHAQAVEGHRVPGSFPDAPGHERVVARQAHLAVGEAGPGPNVGGAKLGVVAGDLSGADSFRRSGYGCQQ